MPCARARSASKRSGTPIVRLRVAGGGSQSDAAMQLTADIFGLPAERPHVYEASGLGAAIDCAVGLGLYPDVASAVAGMTRVGRVFLPQAEARQIYQRLYGEVCACIASCARSTAAFARLPATLPEPGAALPSRIRGQ